MDEHLEPNNLLMEICPEPNPQLMTIIKSSVEHISEVEKSISKRKSYPVSLKLEAVALAKKSTKEHAARHFGVDSKQIREWCRAEDDLRNMQQTNSDRLRLGGSGRTFTGPVDLTMPKIDNYVSKRKSYTVSFKLEAVEMAKKYSKERVARIFGVDSKRIREWCKTENELRKLNGLVHTDKKRLDGGGRHCMSNKLEKKLLQWIDEQQGEDVKVTRKLIAQKAVEIFRTDEEVN